MGSKRNIIDFVIESIEEVIDNENQRLYDIFGGSGVVSGAFRDKLNVTCNDIQVYTGILAGTYLQNYYWKNYPEQILDQIIENAHEQVNRFKKSYARFNFIYDDELTFSEIVRLENKQKELIRFDFNGLDHLFVKNYSGTYWAYEQCLWIDALSSVARSDEFRETFLYNVIMSSLMFAMAYCTQSTGHYAQYREVTKENMEDILIYRRKEILPLFEQKFKSLREAYNEENNTRLLHRTTQLDYKSVLSGIENNSIVYADPPYQFVHYSRFYHILETLARYDYPDIRHKGRYRTDRHQSPFCIRTKVKQAFTDMFTPIYQTNSSLILSYSDTGMISKEELLTLAKTVFISYQIRVKELNYKHSTMGRQGDKNRDVKEVLIICTPNQE